MGRTSDTAAKRTQNGTYSIDNSVQVLQTLLLEDSWVHVVLEESVVDGETDTVQTEGGKAFCVLFREEVVQELNKFVSYR
jgi:hypothetical protein